MVAVDLSCPQIELPKLLTQRILVNAGMLDLQPEAASVREDLALECEVVLRVEVCPEVLGGQRRCVFIWHGSEVSFVSKAAPRPA